MRGGPPRRTAERVLERSPGMYGAFVRWRLPDSNPEEGVVLTRFRCKWVVWGGAGCAEMRGVWHLRWHLDTALTAPTSAPSLDLSPISRSP